MKKSFKVTLDMPEGVSIMEICGYIVGSIRLMRGSYSKDDPIFELDRDTVKCTPIKEEF